MPPKLNSYSNVIEAIKKLINNRVADVRCGLPGKIVKYDYASQKADVQPLVKHRYPDDTVQGLPVITDCPVIFPRVLNSYVYIPLKVGDKVWILFSDFSLDQWIASGAEVDPLDTRVHDLTDAVVIPGCYDFNSPITDLENANDIVIKNADMKIILKPNGTCKIIGKDGVDLITQAYNLADEGSKITVDVPEHMTSNVAINNASAFSTIKTAIGKLKV